MSSFERLGVLGIVEDVRSGRRAAREVARESLARIGAYEKVQPSVWIHREAESDVLERAAEVDGRAKAGEPLPLAGAPFAVKDNIDVAGRPTTAACPAFAYTPDRSAAVVERLTRAGAVYVGKTNLDQFATGLSGARSPYGALGSVYNRAYISGGSSSGSAVAVAAGLVAFALGTDTAGSGRVPAAFNHLVGFKPTRGRWSASGVVPACRTLDCVSVLCGSAAEAALIDGVVAGFDPDDPFSRRDQPGPAPAARFRFGVPAPGQVDWRNERESQARFDAAVRRLERAGGKVVAVDISALTAAGELLYGGPWVAERTAAVSDLLAANPAAIHPVVRGILEGGRSLSAVDAFRGWYRLQELRRRAEAIWREIDVLLLPTTVAAYRISELEAEPLALNADLGRHTTFVNLMDLSAVALPAGFRRNATGFGVSLIGPAFADQMILQLARRYEEIEPMPEPPPLDVDVDGVKPAVRLAVVGAHLAAMPLHWQLASRKARLWRRCKTARAYRLYAMAGTQPPKPALAWVGEGGAEIDVEVYELGVEAFGSFVAEVPPPLAIGTVMLDDGDEVKGFVAEPRALDGAKDVTHFGGWRAYIASLSA